MDVKEFVKTSIVQIIHGVAEAIQETNGHHGTRINPSSTLVPSGPQHVKFDIAVTVQEDTSVKGSGSVSIATLFKANGGAETTSANTAVSRLSFSVPVCLPTSDSAR